MFVVELWHRKCCPVMLEFTFHLHTINNVYPGLVAGPIVREKSERVGIVPYQEKTENTFFFVILSD